MKSSILIFACAAAASVTAAEAIRVDPKLPPYQPAGHMGGKVRIVGGGKETMEVLTNRWIELFRKAQPDVTCTFEPMSHADAMQALATGAAELAFETQAPVPSELQRFKARAGYAPLEVTIGQCTFNDKNRATPLGVYVHKANPLRHLTLAQLDGIFSRERQRGAPEQLTRWGQLGVTGEMADKPIHLYAARPIKEGGAPAVFRRMVTKQGELRDGIAFVYDDLLTDIVAVDKLGIGFGYYYGANPSAAVKQVAIGTGENDHFSDGGFAEVLTGRYPLARLTNAYINRAPGKAVDHAAQEFLRLVLSKEGQAVLTELNILPLPADRARAELAKLN